MSEHKAAPYQQKHFAIDLDYCREDDPETFMFENRRFLRILECFSFWLVRPLEFRKCFSFWRLRPLELDECLSFSCH